MRYGRWPREPLLPANHGVRPGRRRPVLRHGRGIRPRGPGHVGVAPARPPATGCDGASVRLFGPPRIARAVGERLRAVVIKIVADVIAAVVVRASRGIP